MEELNQFLNSVEASARRILKQQHKKQQEIAVRDRVALARGGTKYAAPSPAKDSVSRDELRASYGSLIVAAPSPSSSSSSSSHPQQRSLSPGLPSSHRSEHASETYGTDSDVALLPRLPQSIAGDPLRTAGAGTSSSLPTLDRGSQQQQQQQAKKDAVEVAKRANRERRASSKILGSPLYRSLAKSKSEASPPGFGSPHAALRKTLHDVDHVSILLRKMGLRAAAGSPTQRPDHAVERRMCNACWATPHKLTGCEHHNRVAPSGTGNHDAAVRSLELQGPTSWSSDDLYVKYRSELDREALWTAFNQLKADAQQQRDDAAASGEPSPPQLAVVPVVARHPVVALFVGHITLENTRVLAATRRLNQSKAFVFDVNHVWLTNLDHFNAHTERTARRQHTRQLAQARAVESPSHRSSRNRRGRDTDSSQIAVDIDSTDSDSDTDAHEAAALRGRRDNAAIAQGYSQIQSVSTACALQHAVFPGSSSSRMDVVTTTAATTAATTRRPVRRKRPAPPVIYPLSLLVCGAWQPGSHALERVPGVALTGRRHALWWRYRHDNNADSDALTMAVAMFTRDAVQSSSNAILVALVLALDAPMLAPLGFAWLIGAIAPLPAPVDLVLPLTALLQPLQCISHCTSSLIATPLESRLDTLLPSTIVLLNTVASSGDHVLALDEPFGHRRLWREFDRDAFRQSWLVQDAVKPVYDVVSQHCSVLAAQPNVPGVGGRFCWHAPTPQVSALTRVRVEQDFVYIVHNDSTSGSNAPMYVAVSMAHEAMVGVHAAKLTVYLETLAARQRQRDYAAKLVEIEYKLEVGRLALDAKRHEQQRIEQELAAAAAVRKLQVQGRSGSDDRVDASVLREWNARLEQSVVVTEQRDWQQREVTTDSSAVMFYYSRNALLPPLARFTWTRPADWRNDDNDAGDPAASVDDDGASTSRSDASSSSESSATTEADDTAQQQQQAAADAAVAQLSRALLEDEQFVAILKAKLGLPALEATVRRQSLAAVLKSPTPTHTPTDDDDNNNEALQLDWADDMAALTDERDPARASLMACKIAKLQLAPHCTTQQPAAGRGAGWKRLKPTKLPRDFARSVYAAHTEGPRSAFINQPNHATPIGMLDPAAASAYESPEFVPELRVLVVPRAQADLNEKKAIWAEYTRQQPSATNVTNATNTARATTPLDDLLMRDPSEAQATMADRVRRAVLCARNNNLEGLEDALDSGVDVNARDDYGNSLFVLACQQGNKRLAKLLLRRRADMNLQNMNGNTALHYLVEYKHMELVEYLKAKGAVDTITNASGLTCYEGLSADTLEQQ